MAAATTVMAVSAAVGAGATLYSAFNTPDAPKIPPPPPPANYYSYDADGNPAGEQVWDAERNAYVFKPAPLTEAQKVEKAKRDELRGRLLDNLSQAPEDRIKAYDEYARVFSESMHKDFDKRFDKIEHNIKEDMSGRGMFGSKAYVDTLSDLTTDRKDAALDISERATLAREDLASRDRNQWLGTLGYLDSGRRADEALTLEKAGVAGRGAESAFASTMGSYGAGVDNRFDKWQIESGEHGAQTQAAGDLTGGLLYLYGGMGKGGGSIGGTRSGVRIH